MLNVNGYSYTSPVNVRIDLMRNSASLSATYSNFIIKYNVSAFTLKDKIYVIGYMIIQLELQQIIPK